MTEYSVVGLRYEIRSQNSSGDWVPFGHADKEGEAVRLYEAAKKKQDKVRLVKVVEIEIARHGT